MDNMESTQNLNVGVKTIAASSAAALFRIFLMPVDTVKVREFKKEHQIVRFECRNGEASRGHWHLRCLRKFLRVGIFDDFADSPTSHVSFLYFSFNLLPTSCGSVISLAGGFQHFTLHAFHHLYPK